MSTWRDNPDLMDRLAEVQNHAANLRQDIMTFCAFFDTRAELLAHVERYEKKAADYRPPARSRRARSA